MTGSAKQSKAASERLDCFVAEFIIGPARGGTCWLLAMTVCLGKREGKNCGKQRQKSMGLGQGRGERLACDSFGVFRRGDRAVRLRQRHRRYAARRAGLPVDGTMLPGNERSSGDADGPRALE